MINAISRYRSTLKKNKILILSSSVWLDSVICVVKSKHSDTVRDDENAVLCSVQHYRLDPGIKEWAEFE